MTDNQKKYFKIGGIVMAGIAGVFGLIMLFSVMNLGCISAPKKVEGEPPACSDAKYIAYAFHRNQKVPETVISNGLATCRNQHVYNFCLDKVKDIEDKTDRDRTFQSCWDKNKQQ